MFLGSQIMLKRAKQEESSVRSLKAICETVVIENPQLIMKMMTNSSNVQFVEKELLKKVVMENRLNKSLHSKFEDLLRYRSDLADDPDIDQVFWRERVIRKYASRKVKFPIVDIERQVMSWPVLSNSSHQNLSTTTVGACAYGSDKLITWCWWCLQC